MLGEERRSRRFAMGSKRSGERTPVETAERKLLEDHQAHALDLSRPPWLANWPLPSLVEARRVTCYCRSRFVRADLATDESEARRKASHGRRCRWRPSMHSTPI